MPHPSDRTPPSDAPGDPLPAAPLPAPCAGGATAHGPADLTTDDLVAFADGELGDADVARVRAHVDACAACSRELALLRRSGELLARLPAPAGASRGFTERVLRGLPGAAGATSPAGGRILAFPRVRAAIAAAVLVVVSGGVWLAGRSADGDLSGSEEEAIARDLLVLANLEALEGSDPDELARLADDLDAIEAAEIAAAEQGG